MGTCQTPGSSFGMGLPSCSCVRKKYWAFLHTRFHFALFDTGTVPRCTHALLVLKITSLIDYL